MQETQEDKNFNPSHGLVALIDVLGAKNIKPEFLLKSFAELHDILQKKLNGYRSKFYGRASVKIELATFGDTLILTWDMEKESILKNIKYFGLCLSDIIYLGLERSLPLRGAISSGLYYKKGNYILGKALYDAAEWYEQADWLGLILTPECGFNYYYDLVNRVEDIGQIDKIESQIFIEYDVPLKHRKNTKLWTVGWPAYYGFKNRSKKNCQKLSYDILIHQFYKISEKHGIPLNTESKYINSLSYFQNYWTKDRENFFINLPEKKP